MFNFIKNILRMAWLHIFRLSLSVKFAKLLSVGAMLKKILLFKYALGKVTFFVVMLSFSGTAQQHYSDTSVEIVAIQTNKKDTAYLANLAKAMQKLQYSNPKRAEQLAIEGAKMAEKLNLRNSSFIFYKFLGNLATKQKQTPAAVAYFTKALYFANANHNPYQLREIAEDLENIYHKTKQEDSVNYFKTMEEQAKARIIALENNKLVHQLEEELYTEEQEIQMLLQDNQHKEEIIKQQQREEYAIFLCCILAVIMLYVLFRNFKQKQQLQALKKNKQLEEIADITSHQLRGPVASIMGLVSLFNKDNPDDPFNKEIVEHLDKSAKDLDKVIHTIVEKTYEDQMEDDNKGKDKTKDKNKNKKK